MKPCYSYQKRAIETRKELKKEREARKKKETKKSV